MTCRVKEFVKKKKKERKKWEGKHRMRVNVKENVWCECQQKWLSRRANETTTVFCKSIAEKDNFCFLILWRSVGAQFVQIECRWCNSVDMNLPISDDLFVHACGWVCACLWVSGCASECVLVCECARVFMCNCVWVGGGGSKKIQRICILSSLSTKNYPKVFCDTQK